MKSDHRQPFISVIIPVYKAEPYLKRCVDSVLTQSYPHLELILVDDGSPDSCPAMCDEYQRLDSRITVIHKENGGVSSARNAALEVASGDYLCFVDADDYLSTDFLAQLAIHEADVIVSGSTVANGSYPISTVLSHYYDWGGFVGPCEKLYRRTAIQDIRFREDLPIGEDIIFNLSVLQRISTVHYAQYKGYHITDNPNSLTRSYAKRYDPMLDEEWQTTWGNIHASALLAAGIPQTVTDTVNTSGCSVWIYQKIKNYCYPDCPHPYPERLRRIKRQLHRFRDMISSAPPRLTKNSLYPQILLSFEEHTYHLSHIQAAHPVGILSPG